MYQLLYQSELLDPYLKTELRLLIYSEDFWFGCLLHIYKSQS